VRVRSCAAGVGWAVLTYLGRAFSAVASGSEIGTTRGRRSGNTLAACGRVGLLRQQGDQLSAQKEVKLSLDNVSATGADGPPVSVDVHGDTQALSLS
jgi:hypothetical protein